MSEEFEAASVDAGVGEVSSVPEGGSEVLGDTSTGEVDYSKEDPSKFTEDEIFGWAANQQEKENQQKAKLAGDPNQAPATPPQQAQAVPPAQSGTNQEVSITAALKSLATTH